MMKVDVLALGMLTCIRKAFDLLREHEGRDLGLADVPQNDKATYAMLQRGESLGVFQVESRAQMNMLPRLRPRAFYDLVIQVAIVRPGPIQGNMVHPYLKRRSGIEKVSYPSPSPAHGERDELYQVLKRTLGVPLFQEQAMQLAMTAAKFTDPEANGLRRAMATFRNVGTIGQYEALMVGRMVERGYEPAFAQRCFEQIKGFGSYGFPESHAASFAKLVYVSSWLKCHYPAIFAAALLNAQPMGFYAPAQIVREAQENGGVEPRPIDVNSSAWDNLLEAVDEMSPHPKCPAGNSPSPHPEEPFREEWRLEGCARRLRSQLDRPSRRPFGPPQDEGLHDEPDYAALKPSRLALRLGLRQLDGFREDWAERLVAARGEGYRDVEGLARRARLPARAMRLLADADAFRSLGLDRREALWAVRRLPDDEALPLFEAATARELGEEPEAALPAMPLAEHVVADYQTARLSLKGHPMGLLRPRFAGAGVATCAAIAAGRDGAWASVAGVVLVRQRPGKGNAIFITLEDETGIANIVLWARDFVRYRREVMAARLLLVEGRVQKSVEGVVHLMARRVFDRSADLLGLSDTHRAEIALSRADEFLHPQHPRAGHPRNVRILPKSRDFH
jgi:error-prone DNA polymerase